MKKIALFIVLFIPAFFSFGQQKEAADKLVGDGVVLQDKGYPDSAMALYKKAMELDKDNLLALSEMGYSLLSQQKYEDAIDHCKRAIKMHKNDPALKMVYVAYGNSLDGIGETEKAIDVYDDGIKRFPDYAQLYFNKGISLSGLKKMDEAIACFQKSAALAPEHASSHNAIGRLLFSDNKIASLLALSRFLVLEPNSNRAAMNLEWVQKIMSGNVTRTGEKAVTINLSADLLDLKKMEQPDNFSATELSLALAAAMDADSSHKDLPGVERFIQKFSMIVSSLAEAQKSHGGFCWKYYVPYFVEMKNKNLLRTFGYIAYTSSNDQSVKEWLETHPTELEAFNNWSDSFLWTSK